MHLSIAQNTKLSRSSLNMANAFLIPVPDRRAFTAIYFSEGQAFMKKQEVASRWKL